MKHYKRGVRSRIAITTVVTYLMACEAGVRQEPARGNDTREYFEHTVGYSHHALTSLVALIHSCPEWTTELVHDAGKWRSVLQVAERLQRENPNIVESAFAAYMTIHGRPHTLDDMFLAWSKPMLILRCMFELPEEDTVKTVKRLVGADYRAAVDGVGTVAAGLNMQFLDGESSVRSFAAPVRWTEDGPKLTALLDPTGAGSMPTYQPQLEYRFFAVHFEMREGLGQLIESLEE